MVTGHLLSTLDRWRLSARNALRKAAFDTILELALDPMLASFECSSLG